MKNHRFAVFAVCSSNECILCLPHYLTLALCMLPAFSPVSGSSIGEDFVTSDEFCGSYLERITCSVDETMEKAREVLRQYESSPGKPTNDEEDFDRHYSASKLFLNEIDQLQTQLRHILSFGNQEKFCCGFSPSSKFVDEAKLHK